MHVRRPVRGQPGMLADARRMQRGVVLVSGLVLATLGAMAWMVLAVVQPELVRQTELTRDLRESHQSMLDQETGLRAWLATGDETFLGHHEQAVAVRDRTNADIAASTAGVGPVGQVVVDVLVAQEVWVRGWADDVRRADPLALDRRELSAILRDGRAAFDAYRVAYGRALEVAIGARDAALAAERRSVVLGTSAVGVLCVLLVGMAVRARRRLEESLDGPVSDLQRTVRALRSGDLSARPHRIGPPELIAIADDVAEMAAAMQGDRDALLAAREEAESSARHTLRVVELARDVAGSTSPTEVAERVADAASSMAAVDEVVVWIREGAHHLRCIHGGSADHSPPPMVRRAVADGRTTSGAVEGRLALALPMVTAASVIGVLQVTIRQVGAQTAGDLGGLELLALMTGSALAASRTASQVVDAADRDGLTGLLNRRRFDVDLGVACAQADAGGPPVSLLLLDLDHFKAINDTHGHPRGDAVLRHVAVLLAATGRPADGTYRIGGEEFALLLRGTSAADAGRIGERLRRALAGTPSPVLNGVTGSFGAAQHEVGAGPEAVLAAADAALYRAKAGGRDRVEVHDAAGRALHAVGD